MIPLSQRTILAFTLTIVVLGAGYMLVKGQKSPVHDGPVDRSVQTGLCRTPEDCTVPESYLIQSRCPFTAACIEGSCEVVCPIKDHNAASRQCQHDSECDCTGYPGNDGKECRCSAGVCVMTVDMEATKQNAIHY